MTTKTYEKVKQILVERFVIEPSRIHLESDLQKDLNLDSMDAIDLLLALNEVFKIRIPEQSLEKVRTISELVVVIEQHKPKLS